MEKHDIFTFTAPNGVEVTGVVIDLVGFDVHLRTSTTNWLCYAQNRLFLCLEKTDIYTEETTIEYCTKVLIDYCVIPFYDGVLEAHEMSNSHV